MGESKLIVVSVRLPVRLERTGEAWQASPSPGGLATALRSVARKRPFTWVGWPGVSVPVHLQDSAAAALTDFGRPVFLVQKEFQGFYEQFSNRLIWPLFHNISGRLKFDRSAWYRYRVVNERFADAVLEVAEPGDTVWVHDYQLALVPRLLRKSGLECAIGFFLHIPFPSHEIYRTLPAREEFLLGMLGADLIGFHTYEFAQHFRNACLRVLGIESEREVIALPDHLAHLGVHPIGVDPQEIHAFAQLPEVKDEFESLRARFRTKKVILGVDRLDYTKGIPEKLLAFEEFLRRNPHWQTKVVLIQIAAPSRTGVQEYRDLKREVDELVGRINGRYGTFNHTPIVYINQTIPRTRLSALYRLADVAFLTPLRDGMNLVAMEYVAARTDNPGTLILSEFAGAASCLAGARLVNPHNIGLMADVLADALHNSSAVESEFQGMRDFVHANTSEAWAQRFLKRLDEFHDNRRAGAKRLDAVCINVVEPQRRLFILDYGGTLQPHVPQVSEAVPDRRVRSVLHELASLASVYVISRRSAAVLDRWLGDLPIGLVCEDGVAIKHAGGDWPAMPEIDPTVLDTMVKPVLEDFAEHTPGSKLVRGRVALGWHYRTVDPKLGALRAKGLYAQLEDTLKGLPYAVLRSNRAIEVRPARLTKHSVAERLLESHADAELVFCAGNDRVDEGMFEVALRSERDNVITCFVGDKDTIGQYFVESPAELVDQLETMVSLWLEPPVIGSELRGSGAAPAAK
ncbi:MAG: bifunctional alpha,alpha-trehalose-phosphate synthase (UDP-forming)/trehalose-phosphatase [Gemmatimonadota bacterium]|nr:MAG: bifunctional alpha,alpha-trehalose-phosphate synthase (UDP-forming)/trehalose-phosphatase [Gemmatimonadota bacterium]